MIPIEKKKEGIHVSVDVISEKNQTVYRKKVIWSIAFELFLSDWTRGIIFSFWSFFCFDICDGE